jgi:hypothetical protein
MSDEDLMNISYPNGAFVDDDIYDMLESQVDPGDVIIEFPIISNAVEPRTVVDEEIFEYGNGFITEAEIEHIRDEFWVKYGSGDCVDPQHTSQDSGAFNEIIDIGDIYGMENSYTNNADRPHIVAHDPNITDMQRVEENMRIRELSSSFLFRNVCIFSSLALFHE